MTNLLFTNPVVFVLLAVIFILSISVHEFAHAYTADKLGDPTAKYAGRLTLNPLAHLDLIGTLLILLIRVGWGKPVPINSANFKNPRRDSALVAFAGPLSNILLAVIFSLIVRSVHLSQAVDTFLYVLSAYNIGLALFNLLPVFPLDGFNVLYGVLPIKLAWQWQETRRYGIFILLFLIVTGFATNLILPLVDFLLRILGF